MTKILTAIIEGILNSLLSALIVWLLWCGCMVPLFNTPDITFSQALCLVVTVGVLVKTHKVSIAKE